MSGLIGTGAAFKNQAIDALNRSANREQERRNVSQQIDQADSAQSMQLAGLGMGIGSTAGPAGAAIGALAGYALGELF